MNGMDCDTVRDLLPEYARDRLTPVDASRVRAHLAMCDDCAAELMVLEALEGAAVAPPPDLAGRVRLAVEAELDGAEPAVPRIRLRGGRRPWWRSFWTPAAVLATAAAALLVTRAIEPHANDPLDSAAALMARDTGIASPYGDWPGANGEVAGLAMLDDLSTQQLQTLLDRMEQ